jgi:hypothetical protein
VTAVVAALLGAAASLLIATLVFAWQRSLEQAFLLRAEKREIYRRFLAIAGAVSDLLTKPGLVESKPFADLTAITNEIGLVGSHAAFAATNDFVAKVARAHGHLVGAEPTDPRLMEIGGALGALIAILRHDLDHTVAVWPRPHLPARAPDPAGAAP